MMVYHPILYTIYKQLGNFGNFGNFATQNLDMTKALMDCYYYYYSTCRKGNSCPYRHEPSALGHEVMCNRWLEDRCYNIKCPNRHMKIQKKRNQIQCFWENRSGGCKKPHCVFLHSQSRNNNVRTANSRNTAGTNSSHHHRMDNNHHSSTSSHHQDKRIAGGGIGVGVGVLTSTAALAEAIYLINIYNYIVLHPTRSLGINLNSDPCFKNTLPAVCCGLIPIPSSVIIALVAGGTLNSSAANFNTAVNGVDSGTLNTLKGSFGSDVNVILNVTFDVPDDSLIVILN